MRSSPTFITQFKDDYEFLSNFYYAPFKFKGITFNTVEHWFQAHKTRNTDWFKKIVNAKSPRDAKILGRKVPIVVNWDSIKDYVMFTGVLLKFTHNSDLKQKLIETGDSILIEGNYWHDNYWGRCFCDNCRYIAKANRLGYILEQVRDIVRLY